MPWEQHRELEKAAVLLLDEIEKYEGEEKLDRSDFANKSILDMKALVSGLRLRRNEILTAQDKSDMGQPAKIQGKIDELRKLTKQPRGSMQVSLALEWLVASGLVALNDAREIRPNYPKGDDGFPYAHAPGGKPDIECFYAGFSCICEVTMTRDRFQWVMESQPVMRHMRDFERQRGNEDVFALFIAPTIHRDTVNTFWHSIRHGYEGERQRIVPLTIERFCMVLEVCVKCKELGDGITKVDIRGLLSQVVGLTDQVGSSTQWLKGISGIVDKGRAGVLVSR